MTQNRKKVLAAVSGAVLVTLAGVLIAYFAADDKEPNLIGIGEDEITVTEVFTVPNQEQVFAYRKLVQIENTGAVPCYIRVRMEFSDSDVQDAASFSAANQGEKDTVPDDSTFKSAQIKTGTDYYINNLPDGWVYVWEENSSSYSPAVTNGYYYYTEAVPAGESTDALISWVKMQYGGVDDIQAHDVYVYAESVQTVEANSGEDYSKKSDGSDDPDGWKQAWHNFAG